MTETATRFKWAEGETEPEIKTNSFIAYLKKSLRTVVKPRTSSEDLEIAVDFQMAEGFRKRPQPNIEEHAITLVVGAELVDRLSSEERSVFDLMTQGYKKIEIMKETGLTQAEYRTLRKGIMAKAEEVFLTESDNNTIPLEFLKKAYESNAFLLSPKERQLIEAMFSCPDEVEDKYTYVASLLGWDMALIRGGSYVKRGDREPYGRKASHKKVREARRRLAEEIFVDPSCLDTLNRLNHRHLQVIQLFHQHPELGIKELAEQTGFTTHVVRKAFDRLENIFKQRHIRIMSQI